MKTSNYIAISFLIFLFGGILLLFVGAKNYEANEIASTLTHVKKTASFSVVVAEPGAYLVLKNGREFSISQKYKKDTASNFAPFEVRNDTLFISGINLKKLKLGEFIAPEVYCKNVKSIIGKENSNIQLESYYVDSLNISMKKSRMYWKYNGNVSFVSLQAKDSDISFTVGISEKFAVQLDNSKFYNDSFQRINFIQGSLKNNSRGTFSTSGNMHFNVDKTSKVNIPDYTN